MKKLRGIFRYTVFISLFLLVFIGSVSSIFNLNGLKEEERSIVQVMKETEEIKDIAYNEFLKKVDKGEVQEVYINYDEASFNAMDSKENIYVTDNPRVENFKEFLLKQDVQVRENTPSEGFGFSTFFWIIIIGAIVWSFISKKNADKNMKMKNQVVQSQKMKENMMSQVRFEHIAGHESAKKDVGFIIDFLKDPTKYKEMGARLPKGTILYGPPGTGKTLLARAIAGEAGVPFFSVSGSDFVEKYVGVGAKRVRDLFAEARKQAPCIIFIDEMDAVGRKRGGDSHSEKDQTINALLTQLDGFSSAEGIVVIGATNRIEMLDDALVRPGRFDKHIAIPLPELKERKEILSLHTKNKRLSDSLSLDSIAKMTIGFSGAGLETLMNESAMLAVGRGKQVIDNEDIDDAFFKVVMKGDKKPLSEANKEQTRLVAWHEAGHALVAKLLTKKSVPKVTIIPSTSGAGGVTFIIPEKSGLHTRKDLIHEVKTLYAGRIAEHLLTGDKEMITTGASQDIKQATNILLGMIKELGMTDEFGMLYVPALKGMTDELVLEEAKKLSKTIYEETVELMTSEKETLERIANALIEKETIEEQELNTLISFKKEVA